MRQVLGDLHVVQLAGDPAGAYCGKVFADLGADVVTIESPAAELLRHRHPTTFLAFGTNKRSIVVDASGAGRGQVWELLGRADVVIQSLGSGDLAAWGTTPGELLERFPSTVVASISGFGAEGPYATYKWSDLVAQTMAWATLPAGDSELVPVKCPGFVALCAVGHTAALGALAGVLRSRASGAGAHVDCAAYEALATIPSRAGRFLGWEYRGRRRLDPVATSIDATLIPTGVFPCGDGFVSMMSTPQQLPEMLSVLDDDALRKAFEHPDALIRPETKEMLDAALYPWLLSHTRAELTEAAQAAGWPFAGVNTPSEVLAADHLHQRGFWVDCDDPREGQLLVAGPPYRHAEGGWRLHRRAPFAGDHTEEVRNELAGSEPAAVPARPTVAPEVTPLDGVRVLDLTTVWSGPYLTQLLADLGAEVIRIENPSIFPPTTKGYLPRPDLDMMLLGSMSAAYAERVGDGPDRPYNRHAMNNAIARNKLSCTLDPRRPEARELLFSLVERSDVFVENLKASTLHQMGIHESQLMDRNPRLIVLRVPPAGLTGDWSQYTGFGAQFDGLSGLAYLTGHHDSELVETPSTTYMDAATGPAGAFAILAALHYRAATGRGQVIELAQMENVLNQMGDVFIASQLGEEQARTGNRDVWFAPQGVYPCRGEHRWLAITVTDDESWTSLCTVMGSPELLEDERFAKLDSRIANHDALDAIIASWSVELDVLGAFHALQAAGVAAGPQLDDELLIDDPHVRDRQWVRPLKATDVGTHLHIGHPFRGIPQAWRRGSPALGEDNEYVYMDVLGLAHADYQHLLDEKIAVRDYMDREGNPY